MKKVIVFLTLLFSVFSVAQTGDAKVDKMLKEFQEQQNSNTSITFTFNKKTYKDKASFTETDKKTFSIGTSLLSEKLTTTQIALIVDKKKSGTYTIMSGNKNGSVVLINKKYYQFGGIVNLSIKNKKVSGTFDGELYEITKSNPKPSKKSSGKITGSFTN
jgi:hypothetical protein